ncbi:TonB-dependent receptor [Bacteroidota bacterium]
MKISILLLLLVVFQTSANYSQQVNVTLSLKDITLKEALKEIESQTDYTFLFDNSKVNVSQKVNVEFDNSDINQVMEGILNNTDINYKIEDKHILLGNKYQDENFKTVVITGVVKDAQNGEPLPGANVTVKGTTTGTITDFDGKFSIEVNSKASVLVFTFIGYETQEIQVNDQTEINVQLSFSREQLDEVVVIGYGTIKKRDLTGALATLKEEDFNSGVITSPAQMIQGKVAGVRITANSGEPGAASNIQVRGANSIRTNQQPLYVVDGIPLDMQNAAPESMTSSGWSAGAATSPLNFINPNDIESIDILKDASATAIYGARGANGVILITTKKGEDGAGKIEYSTYYGISKLPKKIDVLSADEFVKYRVDLLDIDEDYFTHFGSETNWQDEIFKKGTSMNHNIALSGGNKKNTYYASFNYLKQDGIIRKNSLEKYTGRINVLKKGLNDKLIIDSRITATQEKNERLPIGETTTANGDLLIQALQANPTMPAYDESGNPFQISNDIVNPLAWLEYFNDHTKTNKILGSITPSLEIIKGLIFKVNLGVSHSFAVRRNDTYSSLITMQDQGATGAIANVEVSNYVIENTLTYANAFNEVHNISLLGGHSYQSFFNQGFGIYANGLESDDLIRPVYNIETNIEENVWAWANKDEMQSFFGRINYVHSGKYYLTATYRRDGSSKFGVDNKYGNFPSFSLAWRLSEEAIIKNLDVFDNLKLRGGWGKTGNQEIGGGHSLFSLEAVDNAKAYLDGGTDVTSGIVLTKTPNPGVAWETTVSSNVGLDFAFLGSRLNGSIDYFDKKTTDMLLEVPSKQPAPTQTQIINVPEGHIKNIGIELELNGVIIAKADLNWELSGNFSKINNIVEEIPVSLIQTGRGSGQGMSGVYVQVITNDEPMNTFYGYHFLGLDQDGIAVYEQGVNETDTLMYLGSPHPDFIWGLSSNLKFKQFDFSLFIEGVQGNLIYNNTANSVGIMGNLRNSLNTFPSTVESGESATNPLTFSDRFIEDGSYIRLSTATLGYNMPSTLIKYIQGLRLYVTGSNLFLITDYTGYDPDVHTNASVNGVNSMGIDNSNYPKSRTIIFGLNITF